MIRLYREEDLPAVLDCWYQASLVAHPFLDDGFLAEEREEIAHRWLPAAETTVYETDGKVVGFIAMIGDVVGGLFVHPDAQRQGVGTSLIGWAAESRSFLELEVFEDNVIGRSFYESLGFRHVDERVDDRTGFTQLRLRVDLV